MEKKIATIISRGVFRGERGWAACLSMLSVAFFVTVQIMTVETHIVTLKDSNGTEGVLSHDLI